MKYENNTTDISSMSRYKVLRKIIDTDNGEVHLESANQTHISESQEDYYHTVTYQEENRLDILANNYYDDPKLWWVIAMANNMISPFSVPAGSVVRIPPIISIYEMNSGILNRRL